MCYRLIGLYHHLASPHRSGDLTFTDRGVGSPESRKLERWKPAQMFQAVEPKLTWNKQPAVVDGLLFDAAGGATFYRLAGCVPGQLFAALGGHFSLAVHGRDILVDGPAVRARIGWSNVQGRLSFSPEPHALRRYGWPSWTDACFGFLVGSTCPSLRCGVV